LGGTGLGYFGRILGVALDTSGTIYVADHENRRIQKFDAQGNFLSQFPVATNPFAITIANGMVYVAGESGGNDTYNLLEYDQVGGFIRGFGVNGVALLNVAVDPAGNVYVVEGSHGDVLKFAPDGTRLNNSFGGNHGNEAVATDGNYIYITSCVPGGAAYPL
jgi:sugar lactone lactonase YvrE